MKESKIEHIIFEPFVKFVIELHNKADQYAILLNTQIKDSNILNEFEKEIVIEAFIIKITAEWELFLHNILAYCVSQDTSNISKHLELSLPAKMSFGNAFAVLNGLDFISITSVSEIKNIARKILCDSHNPFKKFDDGILNKIDEVYILRNYIAHKSIKSKIRLAKMYRDKYQLVEFISPGKFLLLKTNFEDLELINFNEYFGVFLSIAVEIWKALDIVSYKFVYEDDSTKDGFFSGIHKMREVFSKLSNDNNLI